MCFEIQKKQLLIENDRHLDQIISQDIVVNSSLDINTFVNVNSSAAMNDSVNYVEICNKCLELEAELIKQHNMVEKHEYNRLLKSFSKLEQHYFSLEIAMQLNKEIFQKNNTSMNQTEPSFDQLYELNNLKDELQAKDTIIELLKANIKRLNKTSTTNNVKKDIELEHRVAKLIAENDHLKQTYKQLYDSIKPSRVHAKEHISSKTKKKNKVEDHSRIIKSWLNKSNRVVEPSGNAHVQHSKLNTNSELMCIKCNSSMFDARHELCFLEFVSDMNVSSKSKSVKKAKKKEEWKPTGKVFTKIGYNWRPTGRTFTLVGNACPLTRITATNKVPLRKPIPLEVIAQESVVTKVYNRRPKVPKINGSNSKPKIAKSMICNKTEPGTSRGFNSSVAPSSSSVDLRLSKLFYGIWTLDAQST
ncbi:hypothetical protein Tco_0695344 [Tanacetum coccineum]